MSKVWVLQHVQCETLGIIAEALESTGLSPHYVETFAGKPLPEAMGEAAGLIVMGGPMGVYDRPRYPFLADEMRLMEQALREDKPILGVCLGSQLLAATLGATVTKGKRKEIGWYPVTLTEAAAADGLWMGLKPRFMAYHWHGDIFELPRGAVSLAASALTPCQAFRYGRNGYGFLFHLEVTEEIIAEIVRTFAHELQEAEVDGRRILAKARDNLPELHRIGGTVFRRWASLVKRLEAGAHPLGQHREP